MSISPTSLFLSNLAQSKFVYLHSFHTSNNLANHPSNHQTIQQSFVPHVNLTNLTIFMEVAHLCINSPPNLPTITVILIQAGVVYNSPPPVWSSSVCLSGQTWEVSSYLFFIFIVGLIQLLSNIIVKSWFLSFSLTYVRYNGYYYKKYGKAIVRSWRHQGLIRCLKVMGLWVSDYVISHNHS